MLGLTSKIAHIGIFNLLLISSPEWVNICPLGLTGFNKQVSDTYRSCENLALVQWLTYDTPGCKYDLISTISQI